MKNKLFNLAKILLSLGLLVAVILTVDLKETLQAITAADWRFLLAALAIYLLGIWVRVGRWAALLETQGIQVPLGMLTRLYFVGGFFNNFLPSGIGGDVVKMYELSARSQNAPVAISTVLVDRALGLLVLLAFALVTLPWGWRSITPAVIVLIIGLSVGSFAGVAFLLNRKLVAWLADHIPLIRAALKKPGIQSFYLSLHRYRGRPLWAALLLSLLFNLTLIAVVVLIGWSLGVRISLKYYFLFVPIISTLLALPISLSGLGIRESGYVYLFTQAGVSRAVAFSMSLSFYAISLIAGLAGGVLYAVEGWRGYRQEIRESGTHTEGDRRT